MKNRTIISSTIAVFALAYLVTRIFAADVTPGLTSKNGDTVNAAYLNTLAAGNINGTFYTGKPSKASLDFNNDTFLVWNINDGIFYKAPYGSVAGTNLISAQPVYNAQLNQNQSLLVFDPVAGLNAQTTISNFNYYMFLYNSNQFTLSGANQFNSPNALGLTINSGAKITNAALSTATFSGVQTGGTFAGAVLTNASSSNLFTIGGSAGNLPQLRLFNSGDTAGGRNWDFEILNGQLTAHVWDDTFTTNSTSFMTVSRQNGNTNIDSIAFVAMSNGVYGAVLLVPAGFQIGLSGTPVAQLNTFISDTNHAFAANTLITIPHGMGVTPTDFHGRLICVTSQYNWSAGDEIRFEDTINGVNGPAAALYADATNVYVKMSAYTPWILDKTAGTQNAITTNNFKVRVYATYMK